MSTLDVLLNHLSETARVPFERAHALPASLYTSEELLAREKSHVFAQDWSCPGRALEIPNPGDYLTWSIADQPIFIARGSDGEIRAFSNVCRHRMMVLLEGRGTCRRVVCPYHAWTYDLTGQLIGAPHMNHSEGFDKSEISLPQLRCEIWEGWIYVSLNENATPVDQILAPLQSLTEKYNQQDYVPVLTEDHVWDTNWKLLTENFMEGYHLPVAHKNTVGAWFPEEETGFPDERFDGFTYQTFIKEEDAKYGVAHQDNQRLDGRWRQTTIMPTVFPCHMYILAPDHLWYLSLRPKGVGQVHVHFGVAFAPEVMVSVEDKENTLGELQEFFEHVNGEDRMVVEGIFKGANAPMSTPGPLCWLEREIHDFMNYLARRLCAEKETKQNEAAE
ncbi:MAG: aromatic ring-hydroxylating oxygenase subunit alpha [Hyphomicrobiales bacterium]